MMNMACQIRFYQYIGMSEMTHFILKAAQNQFLQSIPDIFLCYLILLCSCRLRFLRNYRSEV